MTVSDRKVIRKPEFRLEKMDNELLLFNPYTTNVIYLNETASIIWQLCDGKLSIDEITRLLIDAYPESSDTIEKDVGETIKFFINNETVLLQ